MNLNYRPEAELWHQELTKWPAVSYCAKAGRNWLPETSVRLRKRAGAQPHRNHAALFTVVSRLVNETGDEDISLLFAVANSLHLNFYEDWEEADNVSRQLAAVERLLD